jgi:hypothetical protein
MYALEFIEKDGNIPCSQVGGGAWLPIDFDWPLSNNGKIMTPFLTLRQELFLIPTIPDGMCVTVFSPIMKKEGNYSLSSIRECAVNDQVQLNFDGKEGMRVILHKSAGLERFHEDASIFPVAKIKRRDFTNDECKEDLEEEIGGIFLSKLFGRPSWLQDQIFFPKKVGFSIQITENDLRKFSPFYEGVFNDGSCYLYLNQGIKRGNPGDIVGKCIVQFT